MREYIAVLISIIFLGVPVYGLNTITFDKENTTYVISRDYDLDGRTILIPNGCTLRFNGGIIRNGCLTGDGTYIEASYRQLFGTDVKLYGSWYIEAWLPEWFGAKGKKGQIDTKAIQCALDAAKDSESKIVKLSGRTYYTDSTLLVYPNTSVIGSEQKASWLYASQIMTTADVDALKITATDQIVNSDGVTLKNIIIRNGSGSDYSKVGILMYKDNVKFGVTRMRIDNVQVLYFDYGVKADLYGYSPFSDCDFRRLDCEHNNIGLCVEGHFEGGKKGNKIWMNVNRFEFCRFMGNRIGGIYIHNVWTLLNNVFDQCLIEGNGNEYKMSLYRKHGVFGAKIANWYAPTTGGNVFQNCYFEMNIPRRKGDKVEKGEYKYEGSIFPEVFFDNKNVGNIILQQHDFSFLNCFSSRNKNFVLLNDNSHIDITSATIYDLEKVSNKESKQFFIEFNDAFVPSSVNAEKNTFVISNNKKFQYFHFIATPKGADSKYNIHKNDRIDGGVVELDNMPVGQLID